MLRSRFTSPVLVVLVTLAALSSGPLACRPVFASAPAAADPSPAGHLLDSVLVDGTGDVYGNPDTLIAQLAVEVTATAVDEAVNRSNVAATRMRDALVRAGVARADLQTSSLSIVSKSNDAQVIVGYTASQGLTVKIRNLRRAGAILSAAIAAGGNASRLYGVSFVIDNDAGLLAAARREAFADARRKAEAYARAAGRSLGRVLKVRETAPSCEGCDSFPGSFVGRGGAPATIEPGQQRLTVTVTVEWALDPPSR